MNVVIYARYSSHNQNEQSIEGQIEVCETYAKQHNWNIVNTYIDRAVSGTSDNRAEFQRMMNDSSKKTFEGVLVYQLDRFARNRYDSAINKRQLKKNGVKVYSAKENISEDASGILMESMLEGMAEYYSAELSQKVKRGMGINADNCFYNGGTVPVGFKLVEIDSPFTDKLGRPIRKKVFDIDENTAPIMRQAFEKYKDGKPMNEIYDWLNKKGIKTTTGKEFNKSSLRSIFINKKYKGVYTYGDIEIPDGVPRIVDDDTFNKVQQMLKRNQHAPSHTKANVEYLLTTKLFCGKCKEMMVGYSGTSMNGVSHSYYACKNKLKHVCDKKYVPKDFIENMVVLEAQKTLTDENIDKIAHKVVDIANDNQNNNELKHLQKRLRDNDNQKANLLNSLKLCNNDNVRQSIFEEMEKMEKERAIILNAIADEESSNIVITVPQVKFFLTQIRSGNINNVKYKKLLINTLINKIYLYDDKLTIFFNTQEKTSEKSIPTIEDLESSYKDKDGQPKAKPVTSVTGFFFLEIANGKSEPSPFLIELLLFQDYFSSFTLSYI